MPYVPRPATTAHCAHCNASFEKRHASRKYCSNSCNVQASYARTGYRSEGRPTRADLEQMLVEMKKLMQGQLAPVPATTPKKKITAPTTPAPTAKAAATKPKKKITAPTASAPTAEAVATKPKKKTAAQLKARAELRDQMKASLSALQQVKASNQIDTEWEAEKRRRSAKLHSTTK